MRVHFFLFLFLSFLVIHTEARGGINVSFFPAPETTNSGSLVSFEKVWAFSKIDYEGIGFSIANPDGFVQARIRLLISDVVITDKFENSLTVPEDTTILGFDVSKLKIGSVITTKSREETVIEAGLLFPLVEIKVPAYKELNLLIDLRTGPTYRKVSWIEETTYDIDLLGSKERLKIPYTDSGKKEIPALTTVFDVLFSHIKMSSDVVLWWGGYSYSINAGVYW